MNEMTVSRRFCWICYTEKGSRATDSNSFRVQENSKAHSLIRGTTMLQNLRHTHILLRLQGIGETESACAFDCVVDTRSLHEQLTWHMQIHFLGYDTSFAPWELLSFHDISRSNTVIVDTTICYGYQG